MDGIEDNSLESLSALCSIEHFGLGRYGDPINPQAWEKALFSFQRVLKVHGKLYLSVPVGQIDKICFNAHRVYRPQTIIETLNQMQILEMGYIDNFDIIPCYQYENKNVRIYNENLNKIPEYKNNGLIGLFEFCKK